MVHSVNGQDSQVVEGNGEGGAAAVVEEEYGEDEEQCPSHLPLAPSSADLEDEATTVDPSFIISLIRKLVPHDRTTGKLEASADEDSWEESGCILWDLSTDPNHAKYMVENLLPEVLLANLSVSDSFRIKEICLGIFGNLACHDGPRASIISTAGLVENVVGQFFQEDIACLSETCRLLTVSFQSGNFAKWVEALQCEDIVAQILWIMENTLNLQLLEKVLELLLTIIDTQDVASALLPLLIKFGLPNLLFNLFASELTKLLDENKLDRMPVLDLILRVFESLSTEDSCSFLISSNDGLFGLVCSIVKLTDKAEVSILCPTSVVVIANILTDKPCLLLKLSQDIQFLQGLLDILPVIATDQPARNALWSILSRLLAHIQSEGNHPQDLRQYASVLIDKGSFIMEDVDWNFKDLDNDQTYATALSLRLIAWLLQSFSDTSNRPSDEQQSDRAEEGKTSRLLAFCLKYTAL